jgi:hypothetical protein
MGGRELGRRSVGRFGKGAGSLVKTEHVRHAPKVRLLNVGHCDRRHQVVVRRDRMRLAARSQSITSRRSYSIPWRSRIPRYSAWNASSR